MKVKAWVFALLLLTVLNVAWVAMNASVSRAAGKVQYKAVDTGGPGVPRSDDVHRVLNQQANDGWEYVGSVMTVLIFKR